MCGCELAEPRRPIDLQVLAWGVRAVEDEVAYQGAAA